MSVQITASMLSSTDTVAQVQARVGVEEIDDGAARTIAGWWASSGTIGHVLAALSTGCEVEVTDLLDDIARTRREHGGASMHPIDKTALDMLATWAIYRDREQAS